jgi:hypothetical protein
MTVLSQRSFSRGEIAPELWSRTDLAAYIAGLKTCRNFMVKRTGGIQNRPGSSLVTKTKFGQTGKIRTIPFIFSQSQAYVLELGNQYMRFSKNGQQIKRPFGLRGQVLDISKNATSTVTVVKTDANLVFTLEINLSLNPAWTALNGIQVLLGTNVSGNIWHWTKTGALPIDTSALPPFRAGSATNPGATWFAAINGGSWNLGSFNSTQSFIAFNPYTPSTPPFAALQDITLANIVDASGNIIPGFNGDFVLGSPLTIGGASVAYELLTPEGASINSTAWATPAFPQGANKITQPYEIQTPYTTPDLVTLNKPPQVADVMMLAHLNYPLQVLSRLADDEWYLSPASLGSSTNPPTALGIVGTWTNATQPFYNNGCESNWFVTAVDPYGSESLVAGPVYVQARNGITDAYNSNWLSSVALSWTAPSAGAGYTYNIYRYDGNSIFGESTGALPLPAPPGYFGLVGSTTQTSFTDDILPMDVTTLPPAGNTNPFNQPGRYPSVATFYQNRLMLGATADAPQTIWGSNTGDYYNFNVSSTPKDTDSFNFTLSSNEVMNIAYMLYINPGFLLVFTQNGEWVCFGGSDGALKPGNFGLRQQSYYGAAAGLPVLPIGKSALYVQAMQTIVRDLTSSFSANGGNNVGYDGDDLTIFSQHLLDGHSVVAWAYQQIPDSTVWMVRDDGVLLGLTYLKNQQVLAWHRHDTQGSYEDVCVVPEGNENAVYVSVMRTVNGQSLRFVERFNSRQLKVQTPQGNGLFSKGGLVDSVFMDAAKTYDGRNTTGQTMTLSGGSTWTYQERLTLTCTIAIFRPDMIGDVIVLQVPGTGTVNPVTNLVQCKIVSITSQTVAVVTAEYQDPTGTVPVAIRNTATATWAHAAQQLVGLYQLEGQQVSVLADGAVLSSPNEWFLNPDGSQNYPAGAPLTVTNGTLTLPRPASVVHVGLPYFSDMETLQIDSETGEALVDKRKDVTRITLWLKETRGIYAGGHLPLPYEEGYSPLAVGTKTLYEMKIRNLENYQSPIDLATRTAIIELGGNWDYDAHGCIRQVAPLPVTIIGVYPSGLIPPTK